MITFDEFIAKYDGKVLDTDGAYGGQCMDEMHGYLNQVLGLPLSLFAAPTAYQAWLGANDSRFDKINNSPTGVPSKGDVIFWNTTVGSAGHVATFISGDVNQFTSFDQNWPVGSLCHKQSHDYNGVAGWLHYKVAPQPTPPSNTEGKAAVEFDRILVYLKSVSILTSDAREANLTPEFKVRDAIKAYHDNMESQVANPKLKQAKDLALQITKL